MSHFVLQNDLYFYTQIHLWDRSIHKNQKFEKLKTICTLLVSWVQMNGWLSLLLSIWLLECLLTLSRPKKSPYSNLFSFVFSRIRTEYGKTRSISPYSARILENTDQNNSEYGHFSRSVCQPITVNERNIL